MGVYILYDLNSYIPMYLHKQIYIYTYKYKRYLSIEIEIKCNVKYL